MGMKEWRAKNKDKIKDYNKSYWRNWYLKNREKRRLQNKEWRINNLEIVNAIARKNKHLPKNIPKIKARHDLYTALRNGTIIRQPCSVQNCSKKAEAHHPDYTKPLDVLWLCRQHHIDLHKSQAA